MSNDDLGHLEAGADIGSGSFAALHLRKSIACSLDMLWELTTEPFARALWASPSDEVEVEIEVSEPFEGGREIAICRHPSSPDVIVETGWLAILPQYRTVNYELVTCEDVKLSAALITTDFAGDTDQSVISINVQLTSFDTDMSDNYRQGFEGCLGNLESVAARTMLLKRHVKAPIQAVWAAWMTPEHLPQWWGPNGFTCDSKSIDLNEGGGWVFDMIAEDGTRYPNHHKFQKIKKRRRISYSLLIGEDGPKHADAWASFESDSEGTLVKLALTMTSKQELERAKGFGAVELGYQTLGKLEAYAQSLS